MLKIITIGILLFLLYRLVFPTALPMGKPGDSLDDPSVDEDDYIDYEEVD